MDRRWVVAAGVLALAAGGGVWFGRGVEAGPDPPAAAVAPAPSLPAASRPAETIVVHVAGWVAHPGVVEVPAGARIARAVAEAGGARPGAAIASVNLAQALTDGQQVVVPGPGSGPSGPVVSAAGAPADGLVRLNSAPAGELESLPGVGPVLAERIVSHRESQGPFQRVEDLLEVPGIGETKLASLRDLVAVP